MDGTSLDTPSIDIAPLTMSSPPTAPDAGRVARAALEEAVLLAPASEASK